jgi:PAS domain S-box-containing protein
MTRSKHLAAELKELGVLSEGASVAGERVLVIDNVPGDVQSLVTEVLSPYGYQAVTATDGLAGLRLALSEPLDLVIVDLKKLDLAAMDVIKTVTEKRPNLPVILVVAQGLEEVVVQAFRLGAKDCLVWPFKVDDMLAAIDRSLQEARLRQERDQLLSELVQTNKCLERRVSELSALCAIGKSVTSYLDLERVLNRVVEAAVYITRAEEGYLMLLDQDTGELYMRASQNMGESHASEFRLRVDDSIAGRVVCTGEPVILGGSSSNKAIKIKTGFLVKSLLNVPLKVKDRAIGVLGVDNQSHGRPFAENDLRLLTALADYAVVAIENANLHKRTDKELERRVCELSAIHQIAQELNATLDLERIMTLVVSQLGEIAPDAAALMMLAPNGGRRWQAAGYLSKALANSPDEIPWHKGIIGRVVTRNRPALIADVTRDPDWLGYPAETRSQVTVPIQREGQVMGVVSLESSEYAAFDRQHLRFLVGLAEHTAVALESARLFEVVLEEQRKHQQIVACIADGVFTVDRDLRILTFNSAAERITGWSEKEAIGRYCATIFRFVGNDLNGAVSHLENFLLHVMESQQPVASAQHQEALLTRSGRLISIATSAAPLVSYDGQVLGAVAAMHDISAERKFEQAKDDFIAMVSHELRAPLSTISASVELMSQHDTDDQLQQEMLEIVQTQSARLADFVKEIVDISQLKAGQVDVHLQPVPMLLVVKRVLSDFRLRDSTHRFELLSSPGLPFVLADETKVAIVLTHLLENASQFSAEGTTIVVEVQYGQGDGDGEVIVSVADQGIGIASEYHEKVFERFFRVNISDAQEVYGEGLGLYISKRLIEMQGGRIWVESRGDQGTRFSFSLPKCTMLQGDEPVPTPACSTFLGDTR